MSVINSTVENKEERSLVRWFDKWGSRKWQFILDHFENKDLGEHVLSGWSIPLKGELSMESTQTGRVFKFT